MSSLCFIKSAFVHSQTVFKTPSCEILLASKNEIKYNTNLGLKSLCIMYITYSFL